MPRSRKLIVALPVLALMAAGAIAGPIAPPAGPVGSTMKTLTEVEPRTAINSTNTPGNAGCLFVITQPGSYYLSGNVAGVAGKDGIVVAAPDVTVDLNGFALIGVPGSATGINASNGQRVTVRNGVVRSWGASGIYFNGGDMCTADQVSVVGCGWHGIIGGSSDRYSSCNLLENAGSGISAGYFSTITGCIARGNGHVFPHAGITAYDQSVIESCIVSYSGAEGIATFDDCRVVNCSASYNATAGITSVSGANISGCTCGNNDGDGITVGPGSTVESCGCRLNGDDGIQTESNCVVARNTCDSNGPGAGGAGVYVVGSATRVEENHVTSNRYGVLMVGSATDNFVVRNTARSNVSANFSVSAGNELAPVITNPGGNGFVTATPWSNFAY